MGSQLRLQTCGVAVIAVRFRIMRRLSTSDFIHTHALYLFPMECLSKLQATLEDQKAISAVYFVKRTVHFSVRRFKWEIFSRRLALLRKCAPAVRTRTINNYRTVKLWDKREARENEKATEEKCCMLAH